jgi:phosphomannomutase
MTLFGTAGIRGPVSETVTPELALSVGRAVGSEVENVVIGRDARETGDALAAAAAAGAQSAGASVVRIGQVSTPALAYASRGRHGIMLTASHNPPADNGIKVFSDGTQYDLESEERIESLVESGVGTAPWNEWTEGRRDDVLERYRSAVVEFARGHGAPLDGLGVVVDCGNGMAGRTTPQVLRRLGASVTALDANLDGHFPARESKPTAESLERLRGVVADDPDAAFGLGHDGDVDRTVLVDGDGEVVHEDTVTAVLAEHQVRRSDAADPVVITTPNTSARIDERVEAAGGRVERVALGQLQEGIEGVRADGATPVFAAEPWKQIFPELGGWMDGTAGAAVLAGLVAAEGLDALIEPVTERPYHKDTVDCPDPDKPAAMDRLETTLPEAFPEAEVSLDYGVRLTFDDGSWALVRPSGTEPYMRVYVESEDVEQLLGDVRDVVAEAVESVN